MERYVELVVAGGLALLAGLWATSLAGTWTFPWLAGWLLVLAGVVSLAAGIGREVSL